MKVSSHKFFINAFLVAFLVISINSLSAQKFDDWFISNTLRIDYYHTGTSDSEQILFKELRKEEFWGGRKSNLIDKFGYGSYSVKVFDIKTETLIYSYGFCSLFEEWQFTDEAKTSNKGFPESLIMPFPKSEVRVELHSRNHNTNDFTKIYSINVKPDDIFINSEKSVNAQTKKIFGTAESDKALDLVFIGDGYTKEQLQDFYNDAQKVSDYLLSVEPFKSLKGKINVWAVAAISEQSGTDVPQKNVWKSTVLNSNFNTFGSERYLTSSDFHSIRNYAGLVPCDQICVLVNSDIYGGGGIYNFWSISSAKNEYTNEVFAHELGHALGALGDEYYDSEVATEDMHNKLTEPYQPNLTTLVNFELKWKDMVSKDTKIPTEVNFANQFVVGVYEGGGYQAKGIYRPYINCRMKALSYDFCPVCQRALTNVIESYCK